MVVEERVLAPDDLPGEVEMFVFDVQADAPAVDPTLAPRLARRRARAEARIAARKATVEAEIERLRQWQTEQDHGDLRECERLDLLLTSILAAEREHDPKRKTLALPYGVTVKARAQQPEWSHDDDALLPWLEGAAPDYIERKPRVKWGDLKDELTVAADGRVLLDGAPVPGVTVQPRPEKIEVKVSVEGDGE